MTDVGSMSVEEALAHYGVRGMKWGVRKGRGTTGLTRHRGAALDRNARYADMLTKAKSGEYAQRRVKLGQKVIGKEQWERNMKTTMKDLNSQNSRLRSGKLTIGDKFDLALNIPVSDLLVSRSPKTA